MKQTIIAILLFVSTSTPSAQAQSLERQVIAAAGSFASAGWGSLSSTIGEVAVTMLPSGSVVLTQGFQQPTETDLAVAVVHAAVPTIKVYPNPSSDVINMTIAPAGNYTATIVDMLGQRCDLPYSAYNSSAGETFTFGVGSLAAASYLLIITGANSQLTGAYKFTKTN